MITHISIDLDGTLITPDFDQILWNDWVPQQYAHQHEIPLDRARKHVFGEYYSAQYIERIKNWTSVTYWLQRLNVNASGLQDLAMHVRLYEDSIPALDSLSHDHELILCTANDQILLDAKLNAIGITRYFAHIISVPTRYSTGKKTSATYERMLDDLHLHPHNVLHVGDDIHQDHDSPKAIGMHALHIDRNGKKAGSIRRLGDVMFHLDAAAVAAN